MNLNKKWLRLPGREVIINPAYITYIQHVIDQPYADRPEPECHEWERHYYMICLAESKINYYHIDEEEDDLDYRAIKAWLAEIEGVRND